MEHTTDARKQIHSIFKKRKQVAAAIIGGIILLMLLAIIPVVTSSRAMLFGMSKLVWGTILSCIVVLMVFITAMVWRCPSCNAPLGRLTQTEFCPKCGIDLIERQFVQERS